MDIDGRGTVWMQAPCLLPTSVYYWDWDWDNNLLHLKFLLEKYHIKIINNKYLWP